MTQHPKRLLAGVVDRPKTMAILSNYTAIETLEVVLMRVYSVAAYRHEITNTKITTVALAVTPKLMVANAPIRYGDDLLVQGRLQTVLVLPHRHERQAAKQLLENNERKILQAQANCFARYVASHHDADTLAKRLAKITANWLSHKDQLTAYQRHVQELMAPHSGASVENLPAMQRHQRELNEETTTAILALTTPLLLLKQPLKRVTTTAIYGRLQRPREAVDFKRLADPLYLHQQAQEIMLDYQFATAHHLPLSGKGTPLSDEELAQWQQAIDAKYLN
ncbi:hypothetical protein [Lacticaseibacillus jixiensis]|uniref:hypothetical protein n=1 Tax=Lacticaseibacillus jixiensis TaxID=3231926 RepID=UPI0036F23505